jgi:hypothetical protein
MVPSFFMNLLFNMRSEVTIKYFKYFYCSFSLFVQRKRTKRKDSLSLDPPLADFPVLLEKRRALRNSLRSNSPRAIPSFSPLLGCVKRQKKSAN